MAEHLNDHMAGIKLREADTFLNAGRIDEARARCAEACRLAPGDANAWLKLGNISGRLGAASEAEAAYRRAISINPELGMAHQFLGNLLGDQGRYAEATACYRRALQIKPHSIPAHINLGTVLTLQGQLDDAMTVFRSALKHEPADRKAALGLAHVYERQGNVEQAWAHLQPLMEEGPAEADAALIFAALAPSLGRSDEAIAVLEQVLARNEPPLPNAQRASVHFRLGRLYESGGRYDTSFEHYKQANDIKARTWRFNSQAHAFQVDALIDVYTPTSMAGAPHAANESERPVFIVGMPRSGTSLVEQILASHPAVFGAGELDELQRIAVKLPNIIGTDTPYPQCVKEMTAAQCEQVADGYLNLLSQIAPAEAIRVTDKMPANFLHLGLIALLFPRARVIHCVRNPLDTCLSCYFQHFGPTNAYTYDLTHLGAFYRQYHRLMGHWRNVLDIPMMEVRYEELVENQEGVSRALIAFCDLEWDERCLNFHSTRRHVATASYDQVRKPMYANSVERWRRYADHLGPLQTALGESGATGAAEQNSARE